jgi:hypothetical protein
VERPPHYDTFGEFQYAYHYGDMYAPYIKQEEPLKTECQHFLDCIRSGSEPVSGGVRGTELVRILEASSDSLRQGGAPVEFSARGATAQGHAAAAVARSAKLPAPRISSNGRNGGAKRPASSPANKTPIKIVLTGEAP